MPPSGGRRNEKKKKKNTLWSLLTGCTSGKSEQTPVDVTIQDAPQGRHAVAERKKTKGKPKKKRSASDTSSIASWNTVDSVDISRPLEKSVQSATSTYTPFTGPSPQGAEGRIAHVSVQTDFSANKNVNNPRLKPGRRRRRNSGRDESDDESSGSERGGGRSPRRRRRRKYSDVVRVERIFIETDTHTKEETILDKIKKRQRKSRGSTSDEESEIEINNYESEGEVPINRAHRIGSMLSLNKESLNKESVSPVSKLTDTSKKPRNRSKSRDNSSRLILQHVHFNTYVTSETSVVKYVPIQDKVNKEEAIENSEIKLPSPEQSGVSQSPETGSEMGKVDPAKLKNTKILNVESEIVTQNETQYVTRVQPMDVSDKIAEQFSSAEPILASEIPVETFPVDTNFIKIEQSPTLERKAVVHDIDDADVSMDDSVEECEQVKPSDDIVRVVEIADSLNKRASAESLPRETNVPTQVGIIAPQARVMAAAGPFRVNEFSKDDYVPGDENEEMSDGEIQVIQSFAPAVVNHVEEAESTEHSMEYQNNLPGAIQVVPGNSEAPLELVSGMATETPTLLRAGNVKHLNSEVAMKSVSLECDIAGYDAFKADLEREEESSDSSLLEFRETNIQSEYERDRRTESSDRINNDLVDTGTGTDDILVATSTPTKVLVNNETQTDEGYNSGYFMGNSSDSSEHLSDSEPKRKNILEEEDKPIHNEYGEEKPFTEITNVFPLHFKFDSQPVTTETQTNYEQETTGTQTRDCKIITPKDSELFLNNSSQTEAKDGSVLTSVETQTFTEELSKHEQYLVAVTEKFNGYENERKDKDCVSCMTQTDFDFETLSTQEPLENQTSLTKPDPTEIKKVEIAEIGTDPHGEFYSQLVEYRDDLESKKIFHEINTQTESKTFKDCATSSGNSYFNSVSIGIVTDSTEAHEKDFSDSSTEPIKDFNSQLEEYYFRLKSDKADTSVTTQTDQIISGEFGDDRVIEKSAMVDTAMQATDYPLKVLNQVADSATDPHEDFYKQMQNYHSSPKSETQVTTQTEQTLLMDIGTNPDLNVEKSNLVNIAVETDSITITKETQESSTEPHEDFYAQMENFYLASKLNVSNQEICTQTEEATVEESGTEPDTLLTSLYSISAGVQTQGDSIIKVKETKTSETQTSKTGFEERGEVENKLDITREIQSSYSQTKQAEYAEVGTMAGVDITIDKALEADKSSNMDQCCQTDFDIFTSEEHNTLSVVSYTSIPEEVPTVTWNVQEVEQGNISVESNAKSDAERSSQITSHLEEGTFIQKQSNPPVSSSPPFSSLRRPRKLNLQITKLDQINIEPDNTWSSHGQGDLSSMGELSVETSPSHMSKNTDEEQTSPISSSSDRVTTSSSREYSPEQDVTYPTDDELALSPLPVDELTVPDSGFAESPNFVYSPSPSSLEHQDEVKALPVEHQGQVTKAKLRENNSALKDRRKGISTYSGDYSTDDNLQVQNKEVKKTVTVKRTGSGSPRRGRRTSPMRPRRYISSEESSEEEDEQEETLEYGDITTLKHKAVILSNEGSTLMSRKEQKSETERSSAKLNWSDHSHGSDADWSGHDDSYNKELRIEGSSTPSGYGSFADDTASTDGSILDRSDDNLLDKHLTILSDYQLAWHLPRHSPHGHLLSTKMIFTTDDGTEILVRGPHPDGAATAASMREMMSDAEREALFRDIPYQRLDTLVQKVILAYIDRCGYLENKVSEMTKERDGLSEDNHSLYEKTEELHRRLSLMEIRIKVMRNELVHQASLTTTIGVYNRPYSRIPLIRIERPRSYPRI